MNRDQFLAIPDARYGYNIHRDEMGVWDEKGHFHPLREPNLQDGLDDEFRDWLKEAKLRNDVFSLKSILDRISEHNSKWRAGLAGTEEERFCAIKDMLPYSNIFRQFCLEMGTRNKQEQLNAGILMNEKLQAVK